MSKELKVTVNRCPVFGCTIPRGIPHQHPAGVSAVMRDPAAPLSADERAELERLRADAAVMRGAGMNAVVVGTKMHEAFFQSEALRQFLEEYPVTHVAHLGEKIHGGHLINQAIADVQGMDFGKEPDPIPRRTLAQSVGKCMAWIMCPPFLGFALFVIGDHLGWWV